MFLILAFHDFSELNIWSLWHYQKKFIACTIVHQNFARKKTVKKAILVSHLAIIVDSNYKENKVSEREIFAQIIIHCMIQNDRFSRWNFPNCSCLQSFWKKFESFPFTLTQLDAGKVTSHVYTYIGIASYLLRFVFVLQEITKHLCWSNLQ